jgi:hypothetical protein
MKRNTTKYIAISGLEVKDELYLITKSNRKLFAQKFGYNIEDSWDNYEDVIQWIRDNARFIDNCICCTP